MKSFIIYIFFSTIFLSSSFAENPDNESTSKTTYEQQEYQLNNKSRNDRESRVAKVINDSPIKSHSPIKEGKNNNLYNILVVFSSIIAVSIASKKELR